MTTKAIVWVIEHMRFAEKDRLTIVNALINRALVPFRAIITVDGNRRILVNGKVVSSEQMMALRESAASALNSQARNLIHDQVRFAAVDQGFLKSDDPKTQLFYKAALWFAQEETDLLKKMAATEDLPL